MSIWLERYAPRRDQLDVEDRAIAVSLFRDSLVQFCGVFGSKPPKLSSDVVYAGQPGADAYFQWLKDLRDGYAAHNFGVGRQCAIGVLLDDAGNVVGAGHLLSVYQGPEVDGAHSIVSFIGIAVRFVEGEIARLGDELLAEVSAMSPEQRLALAPARVYGMDPDEFRKTRAKFRAKQA